LKSGEPVGFRDEPLNVINTSLFSPKWFESQTTCPNAPQ
jgi:hypothetical protein